MDEPAGDGDALSPAALIERADRALYTAKNRGEIEWKCGIPRFSPSRTPPAIDLVSRITLHSPPST